MLAIDCFSIAHFYLLSQSNAFSDLELKNVVDNPF